PTGTNSMAAKDRCSLTSRSSRLRSLRDSWWKWRDAPFGGKGGQAQWPARTNPKMRRVFTLIQPCGWALLRATRLKETPTVANSVARRRLRDNDHRHGDLAFPADHDFHP